MSRNAIDMRFKTLPLAHGNRRRLPVASHSRSGSGGHLITVGVDGVRLKAIA